MKEFFMDIVTFPAPLVGDRAQRYQAASSGRDACQQVVSASRHGIGIYRVSAYDNADDFHRGLEPVAEWSSNQRLLDQIKSDNPKGGRFV